jgi:uncharacterized coiled-coil protein SlyX
VTCLEGLDSILGKNKIDEVNRVRALLIERTTTVRRQKFKIDQMHAQIEHLTDMLAKYKSTLEDLLKEA